MARPTLIPGDNTQVEISMHELKNTVRYLYENNLCSHESVQNMLGLLGGWAVHFYVDNFFREEFGKPYLGSLDIDIFIHCDPERLRKLSKGIVSPKILRASSAETLNVLMQRAVSFFASRIVLLPSDAIIFAKSSKFFLI